MEKHLLIIRHSKSNWNYDDDLSDIDRPLKPRGVEDAYNMSTRLQEKKIVPDLTYTSSAIRALHTSIIFSRTLEFSTKKIRIREKLYMATYLDVINVVKEVDKEINTLFLFGHNPTFTNLSNHFMEDKIENLPTTGIVYLKFKVDSWDKIEKDNAELVFFDYPKNI